MEDLKAIAEQLAKLTVKEANQLVEILKNEHGIEPVAAAPVMVAEGARNERAEATEEKTTFDVVLKSAGTSKLNVVKCVKEITGLGLKDAKELVDNAPKPIKEGLNKKEAEALQGQLETAGAEVELK